MATLEEVKEITNNVLLAEIVRSDDEAIDVSIAAINKINDPEIRVKALNDTRPVKRCYIVAELCSVKIEKIYCDPPMTQNIHTFCRYDIIKAFKKKNHIDITFKEENKEVSNYEEGGTTIVPSTIMYYKGIYVLQS